MDLRKLKSKKGFTLIELMVVIVIIGILVAIALPNFISAQDRAKISSVKANLHTVQTMLETYSVDWSGQYPPNTAMLDQEARNKKYNKELKNPFNTAKAYMGTQNERSTIVGTKQTDGSYSRVGTLASLIGGDQTKTSGVSIYVPFNPAVTTAADIGNNSVENITAYNLYGAGKEGDGDRLFADKNNVFTLTNG